MEKLKILIKDRDYTDWCFENTLTENMSYDKIPNNFCPLKQKLFDRDIIQFIDGENTIKLIESPIRKKEQIAGILILKNQKTYAQSTANLKQKSNKLLYKCIPNDKSLPHFLIPYEIKLGFSKHIINKYVVFQFDKWIGTHPEGVLILTIGDVNIPEHFYDYQLHSKKLNYSIKNLISVVQKLCQKYSAHESIIEEILQNPNFNIQDRRNDTCPIFTIDPKNSTDFDDAFSINQISESAFKVSIYISNVFFWIEHFQLWTHLSKRTSTIYLPNKRHLMLPSTLSDSLCPLKEKQSRFAFVMSFEINEEGQINPDATIFENVLIKVKQNYIYEDTALLNNKNYKQLFILMQKNDTAIKNSHDLISSIMVYMNTECAKQLSQRKIGIFRSSNIIDKLRASESKLKYMPNDTKMVIQYWANSHGEYTLFDNCKKHEIIDKLEYTHITSPIRRLPDLINQTLFFHFVLKGSLSIEANNFIQTNMNNLEYINCDMRSIRKIQIESDLVNYCFLNPDTMNKIYSGIIFDKNTVSHYQNEKPYSGFSYMVHLTLCKKTGKKMIVKLKSDEDLENYKEYQFRIFLFEDETTLEKKIKIIKHE
jgi:exoribonuclease R